MNTVPQWPADLSFRELLAHIRWALRWAWSINAALTIGLAGITLLLSILPAGLALTARGLINAVAQSLSHPQPASNALLFWFAVGLGLALLEAVGRAANQLLIQRLRGDFNAQISAEILRHAAELEVQHFEDSRFQDVLERAQNSPAEHCTQFLVNLFTSVMLALQLVSLTAILVVLEPLILLALLPIGVPYLLSQWRLAKKRYLKEHARATRRRWVRYFTSRLTSPHFVAEVRLLDLVPVLLQQFRVFMQAFLQEDRILALRGFTSNLSFTVLSIIIFYLTFIRVALQAIYGALTIGDVVMYGGAAPNLRRFLDNFVGSVTAVLEHVLHITNLKEFLDLRPSAEPNTVITLTTNRGEIEFRNVSFTYPDSTQPAVVDVSFHLQPGETVALVGESGAGKTTLIRLLARLHTPDSGSIFFDGIDVRNLSLSDLYRQFSFVLQNFGRYEATAAENIAYGDWRQLLHDRTRIEQIAKLANAHDLITTMPKGYDTALGRMFGEHSLSEGQWQKLAVARAFARDAAVFILDEPTSNLDVRSEYALFNQFRELAKGRTTILISHRFSMVSLADRILVMEKGQLVECGTHQELLACAGQYAALYALYQNQRLSSSAA
ncbi:MAG: ABC transporter ATP-binding protein [Candidatus Binatia bacterium]